MLDINPPNSDLDTVAGWVLGTSLVIMVAAAVILGNVWTGGKAFGSARLTSRGQTGVVLVVIACVILASISGAVKYSTKDSMTEDLLPEAAKQRTIRVDRESPSSKCEELVSIASDKHLDGKKDKADDEEGMQYKPTEAEAGKMGKAIREIGADKMAAEKVWTKSIAWGGRFGDMPDKKDWKENRAKYMEKHTPMYSRIQWLPDGTKGKCDNKNFHAAKGAPVEVIFWELYKTGSGSNHDPSGGAKQYGYRMFRIPVK